MRSTLYRQAPYYLLARTTFIAKGTLINAIDKIMMMRLLMQNVKLTPKGAKKRLRKVGVKRAKKGSSA